MKHFMNKLVFGWSEPRCVRLQSPPFFFNSPGDALPLSSQQGAVLNEVSLSPVTFCPFRLMGLLQSCLGEEGERKRRERMEREREGWRGRVRGGYCIAQHNSVSQGGEEAGGFTFPPCFTSQLCLDKHHSTCVITTDTVTFSGHKFRPRLGD